jgi:hypothetical protein
MRFESKFSSVGPKLRLDPERKKIDKMITLLPQLKEAVARGHYLRDLLREIAEENGWTLTVSQCEDQSRKDGNQKSLTLLERSITHEAGVLSW